MSQKDAVIHEMLLDKARLEDRLRRLQKIKFVDDTHKAQIMRDLGLIEQALNEINNRLRELERVQR